MHGAQGRIPKAMAIITQKYLKHSYTFKYTPSCLQQKPVHLNNNRGQFGTLGYDSTTRTSYAYQLLAKHQS